MATELTASAAQLIDKVSGSIAGFTTTRRHKQLYLEAYKAAQNDYFLLTDFLSAADVKNLTGYRCIIKDSDNASSADTLTYDDDDAKLDLTAAGTGDVTVWVDFYTE